MAADPRDYKLDVSGVAPAGAPADGAKAPSSVGRPYLSVQFACCGVYQRVYRDKDQPRYVGRCPRCGKTVTFAVGDGGTDSRFFVVQ